MIALVQWAFLYHQYEVHFLCPLWSEVFHHEVNMSALKIKFPPHCIQISDRIKFLFLDLLLCFKVLKAGQICCQPNWLLIFSLQQCLLRLYLCCSNLRSVNRANMRLHGRYSRPWAYTQEFFMGNCSRRICSPVSHIFQAYLQSPSIIIWLHVLIIVWCRKRRMKTSIVCEPLLLY